MKKMRLPQLFMLAIISTIFSCTGLQNVGQAKKYEHMNVHDFAKKRFTKDTIFLYNASYNYANLYELKKPFNDFNNFCKSKGGSFNKIDNYNDDVFTKPTDLDIITGKFLSELYEKGSQPKWAWDQLLVLNYNQQMIDAYTDKQGAWEGFKKAKQKGLFGEFECDCKAQAGKTGK